LVRPLTLLSLGSGHILTEALLILLFFPSENDRLKMVEAGKWQLPGQVKVLLLSFHSISFTGDLSQNCSHIDGIYYDGIQ